jgi:hypothetical protein
MIKDKDYISGVFKKQVKEILLPRVLGQEALIELIAGLAVCVDAFYILSRSLIVEDKACVFLLKPPFLFLKQKKPVIKILVLIVIRHLAAPFKADRL